MKTTFFAVLSALALGALAAPSQVARQSCTYTCPQGYVTGKTQNGLLQCS
jgi:polyferredoxin